MKNKDKTIALTLLALLVYAFFVWRGMNYTQPLLGSDLFSGVLNLGQTQQPVSVQPQQQSGIPGDGAYKRTANGDYQFSKISWDITGYALAKESGKSYLVYEFTWTNTSDGALDFIDAEVRLEAYQDGIQCEPSGVRGVDPNNMTKIMPGKTLVSYYVIELKNTKSKVETHISEYFVNKDPVVLNVDLSYLTK